MGLYDEFSTCAVCAGMQLTTEMIATRYVDQSPALVCEQCASERNTRTGRSTTLLTVI